MGKFRAVERGTCLYQQNPRANILRGDFVLNQSFFSLKLPQQVHSVHPQVTLMASSVQLQPCAL